MSIDWQKTKTTRRYLTPPMSERLYTLWREGKAAFGEMDVAVTTKIYKSNIISAGLWILGGEDAAPFDFRDAELIMHPDGIPIHRQRHKLGAFDVVIEGFSDFGMRPNGYLKVRVENNGAATATESLAFMLRTGLEKDIVFCGPDVYGVYDPRLDPWLEMPATFKRQGNLFTDPDGRCFALFGDIDFDFSEEDGVGRAVLTIPGGDSCEAVFAYNIGEVYGFDYEKNRSEAIRLWEAELSRINKLPSSFVASEEKLALVKNLTVQLLQCFARPKNMDVVFARQGCLQRQIWLYETMPVIEALSRIGEFSDYIDPVIDSYFTEYLTESGEVVPLAIPWAMATANALQTLGQYSLIRGKEFFDKYRDRAYKCFLWIKNTRVKNSTRPEIIEGIFPPKASCDDQFVFQSWCNTDTFNIRGMKALSLAAHAFGKEDMAEEIDAEIQDYLGVMNKIWDTYLEKQKGLDTLEVPFSPSVPDEVVEANFAFTTPIGYFLEGLDLPEDQAERILRTYKAKQRIFGGLYDRMPDVDNSSGIPSGTLDENGKCLIWYVCCHEYYWFKYFLRHGMKDKCLEILDCISKYAITDEYYMFERYHQRNVWFAPWSPNASASGRYITMLLDYYGAN